MHERLGARQLHGALMSAHILSRDGMGPCRNRYNLILEVKRMLWKSTVNQMGVGVGEQGAAVACSSHYNQTAMRGSCASGETVPCCSLSFDRVRYSFIPTDKMEVSINDFLSLFRSLTPVFPCQPFFVDALGQTAFLENSLNNGMCDWHSNRYYSIASP